MNTERPTTRPLALPATLCLLATLAACGGGNDSGSGEPLPPPVVVGGPGEQPAPPPAPPAPPPGPAPSGPVVAPTPTGDAEGAPVSASIGPAGGSLATPDGSLVVSVPPQAFATATLLTLQPIRNHAHGGVGPAWRITSEGVAASKPVTLRWRYAAEDAASMAGLTVATQRADGSWVAQRGVVHDAATRTVSIQTQQFSDWSLVAGLQLRPANAIVEVGGRLGLTITHCKTVDAGADDGTTPLAACETFGAAQFDAFQWQANGVTGGDAVQGRVAKPEEFLFPGVAAYHAPATVPSANPVAVSARYTQPPFGAGVTLVSNVRVVEATSGCDWVLQVDALSAEVEARYVWNGQNGPWNTRIDHTAAVSGRLVRVPSQLPIVRWRGALPTGQVRVDESRSVGAGPGTVTETEKGSGSPFLGDAPQAPASVAEVTVDILRCKVWVGAEFYVDSQRTTAGLPSATPSQGGGGFAIGERDIGALRLFTGSLAVPATGTGEFPDHYATRGLNNAMAIEQAGSADVRWLFKPAP